MNAYQARHAHQFALRPLVRTPLERAAGLRVSGDPWKPPPPPPTRSLLSGSGETPFLSRRIEYPDRSNELCAAFAPAASYYGGSCSAAVYAVELGQRDISQRWLYTLEPLSGYDLTGAEIFTPAGALSLLYRTATLDGVEGRGTHPLASEGRRLAWCSLAALVGLPTDGDFEAVEALSSRCTWVGGVTGRWAAWRQPTTGLTFLAVVRPDGTLATAVLK